MNPSHFVFGPVPSRRLGQSLGVDVIPRKVCSLHCVYCELGPTPRTTLKRAEYIPADAVVPEILLAVREGGIDHITFSGSGEPTLNAALGRMIRDVKKATAIPVAVITNGTLLFREDVRKDLMEADVVLPSLDAATTEGFALVNRPHPHLRIGSIVRGLQEFRREYRGAIWLEVFLARGMNDSDEELEALRMVLREIAPDKIQLNTVVRPPAEQMAQRVEMHRLLQIKAFLGSSCEIIVPHSGGVPPRQRRIDATAVVGMVARRPMTLEEIASGTGISRREVRNMLDRLEATDTVSSFVFDGKQYFRAGHTPV